ncbi:hypothetical protein Btru_063682 [Bulinus truncatus]|nr:hypothetical protein Btru_063682 [Bulinus truncatus]
MQIPYSEVVPQSLERKIKDFSLYKDSVGMHSHFSGGDVDTISMVDDFCRMHAVNFSTVLGIKPFISINDFTVDHLPTPDSELYDFIVNVANITVLICAQIINSDQRPYNFLLQKRSRYFSTRSGTGVVYRLHHYTEDLRHRFHEVCPCAKCQSSQTPSTSWTELEVMTAAHFIVDDLELCGATCRFFFNGPKEPGVTLDAVRSVDVDGKFNTHIFTCVTCDFDLVRRLDGTMDLFDRQRARIHERYKTLRDARRYMFMVSHPHGWPKQISLGTWAQMIKRDEVHSKFTYMVPACPGSCGAYVHILGYSGKVWHYPHLHKGDAPNGVKESSYGFTVE